MNTNTTPFDATKATKGGKKAELNVTQDSTTALSSQSAIPEYRPRSIGQVMAFVADRLRGKLKYDPAKRRFEALNGAGYWIVDSGDALIARELRALAENVQTAAKSERYIRAAARERLVLESGEMLRAVRTRLERMLKPRAVRVPLTKQQGATLLAKFGIAHADVLGIARTLSATMGRWNHDDLRTALKASDLAVNWAGTGALDDGQLGDYMRDEVLR